VHACNTNIPCPIDCAVSAYPAWQTCTNCSQVQLRRTRTILTFPRYGGAACPDLIEYLNCSRASSCPALPTGTCSGGRYNSDEALASGLAGCAYAQSGIHLEGTSITQEAVDTHLSGLVAIQGPLVIVALGIESLQLPLLEVVGALTLVDTQRLQVLNATSLVSCDDIVIFDLINLTLVNLPKVEALQNLTFTAKNASLHLNSLTTTSGSARLILHTLSAPLWHSVRIICRPAS
jgi:hypothetical protein